MENILKKKIENTKVKKEKMKLFNFLRKIVTDCKF